MSQPIDGRHLKRVCRLCHVVIVECLCKVTEKLETLGQCDPRNAEACAARVAEMAKVVAP